MAAPTQPPTATELLRHLDVLQALDGAWTNSQVNDSTNQYEEGGWIYLDLATGSIGARRAPARARSSLSLAHPPLLPNHVIVGTFNTHRSRNGQAGTAIGRR